MLINFVDNNKKIKLSFEEKLPNQEIEMLSNNNFSLLNDSIYHRNDIEQLQNNVLNRLKSNLKSFGITVGNRRNPVLNKSEELIINKSENNNEKSKNLFKKF